MTSYLRATVAVLALSVAACSGKPERPGNLPAPSAPTAESGVDQVQALLIAGDVDDARKLLRQLLKREPLNASALLLRDSIERDPEELLGPTSYPYTVKAGDTVPALAQRLLGNRLKAYQLGRYNKLTAPFALTPGQVLRIPGTAPRPDPVRRADPAPSRSPDRPATRPAPKAAAPKPPVAAKPGPRAANPALSRQLRTAGLAALNSGKVEQAVGLLRRAAAADPGNPLVARDLARAERIAATVRARR
ncbi:Tetratricopeptide repeat-containing protein [Sphingomonas guangdongensis]|uniref:Tetratricopeptide repeat-containing protein n=1 Tax=Sphingomonas guangdongensis TaxID=1141890 RepID=A0A285R5Q4_9SPHN|nr:tetratricopeptide repeat protein [Sphingomonas guangdongensis]SOB87667.1 Tetratricopeptide repeat-containing protein [Sphingomonas guangdongensis]